VSPQATGSPALIGVRVVPASFRLAAPIQREVVLTCGGCPIYLAGGLDASDRSAAGVFALDPTTGRLTQLGNLVEPVHDAAGTLIPHGLVVFGGGSLSSTDLIQSFDLRTRRASIAGHLPKPLSDLSAAAFEDATYLVGGYDGVSPQRAIYRVSDSLRVRRVGSLPIGLRYPAVGTLGSNLVIAGGEAASGPVSTVYQFDTSTHRVTTLGRLPAPVGHASAITLDGRTFVAGGLDAKGRAVRTVVVVDDNGVHRLAPLARPVSDAGATEAAEVGWILGGWRGAAVAQVLRATFTAG
jgi:hypothetical protein